MVVVVKMEVQVPQEVLDQQEVLEVQVPQAVQEVLVVLEHLDQ